MELIRIDPISSPNPIVTEENFIRHEKLNKNPASIDCPYHAFNFACCREMREPNGGFWLSFPTEGRSCVWRDCTRAWHVEDQDDDADSDTSVSVVTPKKMWSNIRMVRYKCKPDIKLLDIINWEVLKDYVYILPPDSYYVERHDTFKEFYQTVIDFLKTNKITIDTNIPEDKSGRGIIVRYNKESEFSILRSKTGSKKEIMASANYWLNLFNWHINYYQKQMNKNISIDYDKLRSHGYQGIIFRELEENNHPKVLKEKARKKAIEDVAKKIGIPTDVEFVIGTMSEPTSDDYSELEENISNLIQAWVPDTVVVWDYCFTDYEVSFETSD